MHNSTMFNVVDRASLLRRLELQGERTKFYIYRYDQMCYAFTLFSESRFHIDHGVYLLLDFKFILKYLYMHAVRNRCLPRVYRFIISC